MLGAGSAGREPAAGLDWDPLHDHQPATLVAERRPVRRLLVREVALRLPERGAVFMRLDAEFTRSGLELRRWSGTARGRYVTGSVLNLSRKPCLGPSAQGVVTWAAQTIPITWSDPIRNARRSVPRAEHELMTHSRTAGDPTASTWRRWRSSRGPTKGHMSFLWVMGRAAEPPPPPGPAAAVSPQTYRPVEGPRALSSVGLRPAVCHLPAHTPSTSCRALYARHCRWTGHASQVRMTRSTSAAEAG